MESGFLTTNVISHFSQHWREVGHSISVMSLTHELFARKTKRPGLSLSPGTSVDQPSPKCCSRTTLAGNPWTVNGSSVLRAGTSGVRVVRKQCEINSGFLTASVISHFSQPRREVGNP